MISAKVTLTHPLKTNRQFVAETGSGHHILLDDATGATGAKPIELVAVALAGCTAFDVITILRQKHHQKITGYEVRVESSEQLLRKLIPPEAELWCEPRLALEQGPATEKILEVASRKKADLIVLGVHRRDFAGMATHLPIATAHKVVTHARCPVLTVRG